MKKKEAICMFCPKCGYKPIQDEKKSTNQWNVYDAKCSKCKTRLDIKMVKTE